MRLLALLAALMGLGGLVLAARMMSVAQSPPAAYAAAALGAVAACALCVSLLLIWLAA